MRAFVMVAGLGLLAACSTPHPDRVSNKSPSLTMTVQLLGPNGELHPVQQAFVEELSPQCGFCTPGQVVAAVALLKQNPKPTREQARHAMSGNLCRCGAYDNYLNGIMRACGNTAEISHGV